MSRWFRFYDDAVNDPKVQRLPAELFRAWVNLLCLASKGGGVIPDLGDLAFTLRMTEDAATEMLDRLQDAGLLDIGEDGEIAPHNWDARQFKSDTSAERTRRYRKRHRDVTEPVTVTPPDTETETETDTSSSEDVSARKRTPRDELETVLDRKHATAVLDHRRRIKAPLTAHAAKLLAAKFAKCPDPNAAADAMIANGWRGFEPEWLEGRTVGAYHAGNRSPPRPPSMSELCDKPFSETFR